MCKFLSLILFTLICVFDCKPQPALSIPKLELNWRFESSELSDGLLLTTEGIVVSTNDGRVILIDTDSGKSVWINELGGELTINPVLSSNQLLILSKSNENAAYLYTLSLKTGITTQTEKFEADSIPYNTLLKTWIEQNASDNVHLLKENNMLTKIRGKQVVWKLKFGGNINDININDSNALVSSTDNFLYFVNLKNGNKIWKLRMTGRVLGSASIERQFGTATVFGVNKLFLFNLQTGKLINSIQFDKEEYAISKPSIIDNKIIFQTNKGIICYLLKNKKEAG